MAFREHYCAALRRLELMLERVTKPSYEDHFIGARKRVISIDRKLNECSGTAHHAFTADNPRWRDHLAAPCSDGDANLSHPTPLVPRLPKSDCFQYDLRTQCVHYHSEMLCSYSEPSSQPSRHSVVTGGDCHSVPQVLVSTFISAAARAILRG